MEKPEFTYFVQHTSFLIWIAIFTGNISICSKAADEITAASLQRSNKSPALHLSANDLSIATGQPSLVTMSKDSVHLPVWSLSGGTVGQSVAGVVNGLPVDCKAVKVEIVVTTTDETTSPDFTDVYRVHLTQLENHQPITGRYHLGSPVRTRLSSKPFQTRTIVLESYYEVDPGLPLWVRIQREPGDAGDTFTKPSGLVMVNIIPVESPAKPFVVQDVSGYNSWPMMQAIGDKLVCVYSRGKAHRIGEDARAVYARTSTDGGKTWTPEAVVANTPGYGEVAVGKGLDSDGAMLLWVRRVGPEWHQDLYRTMDGVNFTLISTPKLEVRPVQITDIFHVPNVGLMALWFAGDYKDNPINSWGTVTSNDNGKTWVQKTMESELPKSEWPTEPAAVYLGEGKILCIARTETGPSQFQITSTDYGKTWKRETTNISDVRASTPSLILDPKTGLVSNYYYHRGKGLLRRRVVDAQFIFDRPQEWPVSEVVALGSKVTFDAGNVNATVIGDRHFLSYYSGEAPDTSVFVAEAPFPTSVFTSSVKKE